MIPVELAEALREHGLEWTPSSGDRFVLPGRDMDSDVFVLSDMTIELHEYPQGPIIGFNGTTEWALDSVEQSEALWIPREDQLRVALGTLFTQMVRGADDRVTVTVTLPSGDQQFTDPIAAVAYAQALLAVLQQQRANQHS